MEADEVERFTDVGFRPIGLGESILRFETAAIAALAVLRTTLTS
jgi:16S rRNA U1498 N3-methylase RsmE